MLPASSPFTFGLSPWWVMAVCLCTFDKGCGKVGCAGILTFPGTSPQPMTDRSYCKNTPASLGTYLGWDEGHLFYTVPDSQRDEVPAAPLFDNYHLLAACPSISHYSLYSCFLGSPLKYTTCPQTLVSGLLVKELKHRPPSPKVYFTRRAPG